MADIAAIASELTGRKIKRTVVADDAWRDEKLAAGAPPHLVGRLLGVFRDARAGRFAAVDPTLETLLGRRPMTMRDALAARLGEEKPSA